jgi:hypothetical protein
MLNKFNSWLICGLLVFTAMICASSANADKMDKVVFGNAYALISADYPGNPFGDLRSDIPDGVVMTSVDGSVDSSFFKDKASGSEKTYSADGTLLFDTPIEHVCLSVQGNQVILWHRALADIPPICHKNDLFLRVFNGDTKEALSANMTELAGTTSISGCSQADADLIRGIVPPIKTNGTIVIKDGV